LLVWLQYPETVELSATLADYKNTAIMAYKEENFVYKSRARRPDSQ